MDPVKGPWLYGFARGGIGSLRGDDLVRVGPLSRMNFLVGRNNHGKSTMLRAAAAWATKATGRPNTQAPGAATLVALKTEWLTQALRRSRLSLDLLDKPGVTIPIDDGHTGVWLPGHWNDSCESNAIVHALRTLPDFTPNFSSGAQAAQTPPGPQQTIKIPAFRELRPGTLNAMPERNGKGPDYAAGEGLIRELGTWERPIKPSSDGYDLARARWGRLREFMRDVLEDPLADLEVANNQEDLHVKLSQAGRMLHINELGDGIKQVLMIAAACILYADHLVLLEEPEIHLHAGLQRKLMLFLATKTKNQYLIATHSAHVLDLPGARIFHVTHDGTSTSVSPAVRASDVQEICSDLGYMASDLLQANYTIWVEGPSDRIYWLKWLQLVAPELAEGIHFAVMSYGGYLISDVHLQDQPDETVRDLITLLQLGRRCSVIADSDKTSPTDELRETVVRLQSEAEKPGSGHLLVPEWARTVENLVPRDVFRASVINRHKSAGQKLRRVESHTPFNKPFDGMKPGTYSKVEIAKLVVEQLTLEHIEEPLLSSVTDLAQRIRDANGLKSSVAVPAAVEVEAPCAR